MVGSIKTQPQVAERKNFFIFIYKVRFQADPRSIVFKPPLWAMDLGSGVVSCGINHYSTGDGATSPNPLAKPPMDACTGNTGQRIMNKAHPFASALYTGTGFAHMRS